MEPLHHNQLPPSEGKFREKLAKTLLRKIIRELELGRSATTYFRTAFYLMKLKDEAIQNQCYRMAQHIAKEELPIKEKTHFLFQEFHKILFGSYKTYP